MMRLLFSGEEIGFYGVYATLFYVAAEIDVDFRE